jgi:hypothetical protein
VVPLDAISVEPLKWFLFTTPFLWNHRSGSCSRHFCGTTEVVPAHNAISVEPLKWFLLTTPFLWNHRSGSCSRHFCGTTEVVPLDAISVEPPKWFLFTSSKTVGTEIVVTVLDLTTHITNKLTEIFGIRQSTDR